MVIDEHGAASKLLKKLLAPEFGSFKRAASEVDKFIDNIQWLDENGEDAFKKIEKMLSDVNSKLDGDIYEVVDRLGMKDR